MAEKLLVISTSQALLAYSLAEHTYKMVEFCGFHHVAMLTTQARQKTASQC